ncbi:phosphoribosylamine--glycine ligase [Aquibacillus sp. 3ASR75-11]|uniref:Phosphoribosylamine--glycine ligase n=1 Tax=Terrihalobacillus insolitus TaxID=2950438 RepID=A0A9X3WTS5_9BACI|nr:phosphoribosylamine--glycine ligase [Terrihalobacillus insolitus]MDC3414194.1 phosphoribosylamine--glycine ligase [Terrihalobacillus insolitus]MDC3425400.1 phosphoribosylamine--glycine ligase [Terrihalobacillus insolitus]
MNIFVVGSGGREHSMIKKLAMDTRVSNIYVAPGNGGMEQEATRVPIQDTEIEKLVAFAQSEQIDWTIVGPETPLLDGIVNAFQKESLNVFGPTKEAALIEGSKDFAKAFMKKHHIPTADYETFTNADLAKDYIKEKGAPIVIKADGLAAGKGVVVALSVEEACTAVDNMLVDQQFGNAGNKVVVEAFLEGKEFSLMAFVHGDRVYPLVPARDHKRAYDEDNGPNTGGMGAYAPVPDLSKKNIQYAVDHILKPTAKGLVEDGRSFTGILYAGLIETNDGPKVIEFNARFGDPETQVVLPLMENDLLQVIEDVTSGKDPDLRTKGGACVGVVIASAGYPGPYRKGVSIPKSLTDNSDSDCFIVHAGTERKQEVYQTSGGRVLLVGATADHLSQAREKVYAKLEASQNNEDFFYRKDIGTNA